MQSGIDLRRSRHEYDRRGADVEVTSTTEWWDWRFYTRKATNCDQVSEARYGVLPRMSSSGGQRSTLEQAIENCICLGFNVRVPVPHKKRGIQLAGTVGRFGVLRVIQRPIRIGLARDSEANLPRFDNGNFQVRHWPWYCSRSIGPIREPSIPNYQACISIAFCLQPDQLVSVLDPLWGTGAWIIRDESRPAGRKI